VHAVLDAREGGEAVGNVSGDGHAQAVGLGGNGAQHVGLDQVVDFDLAEAGGVVPVHHGAPLGGGVGPVGGEGSGAAAVEQAGHEQVGPEGLVGAEQLVQCDEKAELAAAVARRGDTGGKVGGPV